MGTRRIWGPSRSHLPRPAAQVAPRVSRGRPSLTRTTASNSVVHLGIRGRLSRRARKPAVSAGVSARGPGYTGPRASARQPDSTTRLDAVDARLFEVAAGLGAIAVDSAAVVFALGRVSEAAAARAGGRRHAANYGAAGVFSVADDALGVQPQERVARGDLDGVVGLAAARAAGQAVQRGGERGTSGSERRYGFAPMAAATVYRRASTAEVVPHASPALAAGRAGLRPQRIQRAY